MRRRVILPPPRPQDEETFLEAVRLSHWLHHGWLSPPTSPAQFGDFLDRANEDTQRVFLVWSRQSNRLAGEINWNEIVRGCIQSADLDYYVFVPFAGLGLMQEGLEMAIALVFRTMHWHRFEANTQPSNTASKALVRSLGFRREGFSPRYL